MTLIADFCKKLPGFTLEVSLREENGILGLLGRSGSGKSLTLCCLAGLAEPDEGHIELNGKVLFDSKKRINTAPQKRRIGYLFQEYALFPHMTVMQNIAAGSREKDRKRKAEAVSAMLRDYQLEDAARKHPAQLSGGQKQRCALARIMISEPELLLLDEPFSALDESLKWETALETARRIRESGREAVFVSHDRKECAFLCDSICCLDGGRSEEILTAHAFFERPRTQAAAELLGCRNTAPARPAAGRRAVYCPAWDAELVTAFEVPPQTTGAALRSVKREGPEGGSRITGRVEQLIRNSLVTAAVLRTRGGGIIYMEEKSAETDSSAVGDLVTVFVRPEDVLPLQ